ncbi:MAG: hypothetical protein R6U88_06485 [Candidatus Bipolaricaulota bacterium]
MEQQPTVNVRPADAPRSGEWVVEWWSPLIAGPSYLYFATQEKAEETAARILEQGVTGAPNLPETPEPGGPAEPTDRSPTTDVLHWGRRLLNELPEGVCTNSAAGLDSALKRLEEEVSG